VESTQLGAITPSLVRGLSRVFDVLMFLYCLCVKLALIYRYVGGFSVTDLCGSALSFQHKYQTGVVTH
jgi:hypothetical protein